MKRFFSLRPLAVSTVALLLIVGSAQAAVTLNANVDTTGNLTVDGDSSLGSGGASDLTTNTGTMNMTSDSLTIESDVGQAIFRGLENTIIQAGSSFPDSGEDGDDVGLEAEDQILMAADNGYSLVSSGGGFTIDTAFGGNILSAGLDVTSDDGTINLQNTDSGDTGSYNVSITSGNSPPSAGANGNDISFEAEGSILGTSTSSLVLSSGASFGFFGALMDLYLEVSDGDLEMSVTDSGNEGNKNAFIKAGNAAPNAGEDGNDIALEAEDDVLVEATGSIVLDATEASITIDSGEGTVNINGSTDIGVQLQSGGTTRATATPSGFSIGSSNASTITRHTSGTATNLVSASIGAGACGDYGTISVLSAAVGDTVYASPDASSSATGIEDSNLMWNAFVSAAGTVTIRACNPTGSSIDAGDDQEWRADVWQH